MAESAVLPEKKNSITNLVPEVANLAQHLINESKKVGENIIITSTLRSFAEQQDLFNQGRTKSGSIVTNARAGESYHNYGLAFDIRFGDDPRFQSPRARWEKIGRIGELLGLEWGGRFGDLPHFEYHPGFTWRDLKKYI